MPINDVYFVDIDTDRERHVPHYSLRTAERVNWRFVTVAQVPASSSIHSPGENVTPRHGIIS